MSSAASENGYGLNPGARVADEPDQLAPDRVERVEGAQPDGAARPSELQLAEASVQVLGQHRDDIDVAPMGQLDDVACGDPGQAHRRKAGPEDR